ncbi:MAG: L-seryl-tRNA(Sec) selenium transferase [Armatimonadota bacterium]|nr:L-seryl-tRNA(Sec) selenium transferase [Armatimonadota bacterium]MDR7438357.1 L-seryl-tRNA(Sec) selenium transferase [Armatimonadota bacterium]MDR7563377.1 L-seryl-tRNA(Sec) selenium transferase [Armatimonadota bacterium]MDR7567435.1 L-seryl-tRNA(Sec) selenium transferase [Armatimonadota bacterium]MDR7601680.1 L-seryl-tRNA(Sec) selenium transferase [Armatimonadota bacterium]
MRQPLRQLPSVDRVLSALRSQDGMAHAILVRLVREVLEEYRAELQRGIRERIDLAELTEAVEDRIRALTHPSLRRVLNATGALLHTNLGRAPLAPEALKAVLEAAGACNLEMDLRSGTRGSRQDHVASLLRHLTGAEGAVVVNNNAAAVLLVLSALASGREVVVARSEQVEIGGSFRMPDVMRAAGVRLVEVGTTNRVYLRDYEAAITPDTALLLKVHRSNFQLRGFVADVPLQELAHLGRRAGIPVVYDLGSGAMVDLRSRGLPYEPTVPEAVASGCDLVLFSGDKLLGGPQSGIVVGRASLLERLRTHPLYRVVRADKLDLAALEATLRLYLDPERAWQRIPVLRMLSAPVEDLRGRAERLAQRLVGVGLTAEAVPSEAEAGGGSLPGSVLPSYAVRLRHPSLPAHAVSGQLRAATPPILARVQEETVLLDLRSVLPEDDPDLEAGLVAALLGWK